MAGWRRWLACRTIVRTATRVLYYKWIDFIRLRWCLIYSHSDTQFFKLSRVWSYSVFVIRKIWCINIVPNFRVKISTAWIFTKLKLVFCLFFFYPTLTKLESWIIRCLNCPTHDQSRCSYGTVCAKPFPSPRVTSKSRHRRGKMNPKKSMLETVCYPPFVRSFDQSSTLHSRCTNTVFLSLFFNTQFTIFCLAVPLSSQHLSFKKFFCCCVLILKVRALNCPTRSTPITCTWESLHHRSSRIELTYRCSERKQQILDGAKMFALRVLSDGVRATFGCRGCQPQGSERIRT